MADVTGPISTLPGTRHKVLKGQTCDEHPNRFTVHRVQGETDSFGCEMIDMCQECFDTYREDLKTADMSGTCDWCKAFKPKLRNLRDFEEGMSGRVYQVCTECIDRHNVQLMRELEDDDLEY